MGRNRPCDLASSADHRLKYPPSPMYPRNMERAPGHTPRPLEQDSTRQGRPTQDRRHTETSLPNLCVDETDSPSPTPPNSAGSPSLEPTSSPAQVTQRGQEPPGGRSVKSVVRIRQYLVIWYPKVYVRARSITHRSNTAIPTRPPVPDWFRNTGPYYRVFNPKQTTAD